VLLDRYKNGNGTNNAADMQQPLARMEKINTKMGANQAKVDGKQKEMLARMREDIKSGEAEMRTTLDEWLMDLTDGRKETSPAEK
jgi:hypothetical protein